MTIQRRVFAMLQQASHPASVREVAMVLDMPADSVKRAVAQLHEKNYIFPMRSNRRGQVWVADKTAGPPLDLRGRAEASIAALTQSRGRRRWLTDW